MLRRFSRPAALGLLVACGLLGLVVSASRAAGFTASSYPAAITGQSIEGVENEAGGSVENDWFELAVGFYCKSEFSANLAGGPATNLEAQVVLTNCQIGIGTVVVNMNGCHFRYHLEEGSGDEYTGGLEVVCNGMPIEIKIAAIGCTMTIPQQTGLKKIHFYNETGKGDISVQADWTGSLSYTVVNNNLWCGTAGQRNTGTYREIEPVTLSSSGKTVDIG